MVAMALKKNPNLPIVLCTIPPSADPMAAIKPAEREALNAKIRQLTEGRKNIVVCDLFAALVDAKGSPKAEYFTADKLHLDAPDMINGPNCCCLFFSNWMALNGSDRTRLDGP